MRPTPKTDTKVVSTSRKSKRYGESTLARSVTQTRKQQGRWTVDRMGSR